MFRSTTLAPGDLVDVAGESTVQPAPLSHHDEKEHRRLIALRANSIAYEEGLFTPTLSFATPGDLSVVYTTQEGFYWRLGPLVFFSLTLNCTPTFTTASGLAYILGLPHAAFPDAVSTVLGGVQFGAAAITYPAGRSVVFPYINASEDFIRLAASGSAVGTTSIQASAFTSGVSTNDIRVQGFYPFK